MPRLSPATARLLATGLIALANTAPATAQGQPQMNLPRIEITAGMHRIEAQVAAVCAAVEFVCGETR